jgi:hypothetical protein
VTSKKHPAHAGTADDPAVTAAAGLLHHRHGWIWMLAVSAAGFVAAIAVTANVATGGTAYLLLRLVDLLMLVVFVISLIMVIVDTARLRRYAPGVREPARAVHGSARHPVLAHPHHRHRHPVAYAVGWAVLAGWMVVGVLVFPRLADSVAYLAGAGGRATFMPTSSVQQCIPSRGGMRCVTATNGELELDGHASAATWPGQVPLNVPFSVREPVWRWGLGSGLITSDAGAVGTFIVCLLLDAAAVLAVYIAIRPWLIEHRRHKPAARSPARR